MSFHLRIEEEEKMIMLSDIMYFLEVSSEFFDNMYGNVYEDE